MPQPAKWFRSGHRGRIAPHVTRAPRQGVHMSKSNNKPMALVIGAAVATGTLVAGSLFSMQAMASGYMQDAAAKTTAEGKCGEGKCGEGKCGEGKCGGEKKADAAKAHHEGGCGMAKMDTDKDGRL